jgi:hypothetical protein
MSALVTMITNQMKPNKGWIMDGVNGPPSGWVVNGGYINSPNPNEWAPSAGFSYGGPTTYENNGDGTWSLFHAASDPFYWVVVEPGIYRYELELDYAYSPKFTDGSGGPIAWTLGYQRLGNIRQVLQSGIPSGQPYSGEFTINLNVSNVRFQLTSRVIVRKFKLYKIG